MVYILLPCRCKGVFINEWTRWYINKESNPSLDLYIDYDLEAGERTVQEDFKANDIMWRRCDRADWPSSFKLIATHQSPTREGNAAQYRSAQKHTRRGSGLCCLIWSPLWEPGAAGDKGALPAERHLVLNQIELLICLCAASIFDVLFMKL